MSQMPKPERLEYKLEKRREVYCHKSRFIPLEGEASLMGRDPYENRNRDANVTSKYES